MNVNKSKVKDVFNSKTQYIIPIYQRQYNWTTTQCKKLIEDIFLITKTKQEHFLGTIVRKQIDSPINITKHSIIDGQQRLTTLLLTLVAVRDLEIDNEKYFNYWNQYIINKIEEDLIDEEDIDENEKYKILRDNENNHYLERLIDCTYDFKKNPGASNNIVKNYRWIKNCLKEKYSTEENTHEELKNFIVSMFSMQFVDISLETNDNAQEIFECINGTGTILSSTDLIKNFILMNMSPKEQKKCFEKWMELENLFDEKTRVKDLDTFVAYYLTIKTGISVSAKKLYENFHKYGVHKDKEEICEDLLFTGKLYKNILNCEDENDDIKHIFYHFKILDIKAIIFFILKIYYDYKKELLTLDHLRKIYKTTESYILRKAISKVGKYENNHIFENVVNNINQETNEYLSQNEYYEIIINEFKKLCKVSNAKHFPSNEQFYNDFINAELYENQKDILKYIFIKIEEFDNKSTISKLENYTIEHILPQNIENSPEWKSALGENYVEVHSECYNKIGNITLTLYNSEMSNKPFNEKLKMPYGFAESALRINKFLLDKTEWTQKLINQRTEEMYKIALQIWDFPDLSDFKIEEISNIESINDYNTNEDVKLLFNELFEFIYQLDNEINPPRYGKERITIPYKKNKFLLFEPNKNNITILLNLPTNIEESDLIKKYSTQHAEGYNYKIQESNIDNLEQIKKYIEDSLLYVWDLYKIDQ